MSNINDAIIESGIVRLIDLNRVNTSFGHDNEIPKYENMHIFVELSARRRGRSVITSTSGSSNVVDTDGEITVNLMGVGEDGDFTTKWDNINTGIGGQTETFGITQLNIKTDASYIPQISIEFTDIRGYSFFDNDDSPYRIIFDFPPPLFTLKVKGYYGKALTYLLHLVKYTSKFDSANGNFIINGEFVAITFAPLTDVLFRYVLNFPLMNRDSEDANLNPEIEPQNTYELILKLKTLYSNISETEKTSAEREAYEKATQDLEKYQIILNRLDRTYKTNKFFEDSASEDSILLFSYNDAPLPPFKTSIDEDNNIRIYGDFSEYNKVLMSMSDDDEIPDIIKKDRLFFGIKYTNVLSGFETKNIKLETHLAHYLKSIFDDLTEFNIKEGEFLNKSDQLNHLHDTYLYIDITDIYLRFFKAKIEADKQKSTQARILNEKINELIIDNIGMQPTIYNIFKLILGDVDKFFETLRNTSEIAQLSHKDNYERIIGDQRYRDSITSNEIFSFPLIINEEHTDGIKKEVRASPAILEQQIGYRFPEMDLVDDFIRTFLDQRNEEFLLYQREELDDMGMNKWIPITPLDSHIFGSSSPYIGIFRRTNLDFIFSVIVSRFYIFSQYVYGKEFFGDRTMFMTRDVFRAYGDSEAANLAEVVSKTKIINNLIGVSELYENNLNLFYDYLKNQLSDLYAFDGDFYESFLLGNRDVYSSKKSNGFIGLNVYVGDDIKLRSDVEKDNKTPIDKYLKRYEPRRILGFLKIEKEQTEDLYEITNQNILYLSDDDNIEHSRYITYYTNKDIFFRENNTFKGDIVRMFKMEQRNPQYSDYNYGFTYNDIHYNNNDGINYNDLFDLIIKNGNFFFYSPMKLVDDVFDIRNSLLKKGGGDEDVYYIFNRFIERIKNLINNNKYDLYNKLINYEHEDFDEKLSELYVLSMFGSIQSPFNIYYNSTLFNRPLIAQVPMVLIYYLGCLSKFRENLDTERIIDFYTKSKAGKELSVQHGDYIENKRNFKPGNVVGDGGLNIAADLYDVANNLSMNDRNELIKWYNVFNTSNFNNIIKILKKYIDDEKMVYGGRGTRNFDRSLNILKEDGDFKKNVIDVLFNKTHLLIHSDKTFNIDPNNEHINSPYISLEKLKEFEDDPGDSSINIFELMLFLTNTTKRSIKNSRDIYFKSFFENLSKYLKEHIDDEEREENEIRNEINDNDIRTQTYYSFKNINDKWLSGIDGILDFTPKNYPFTESNLIDSFVFVDRTMRHINNTIINPEILLDIYDNPDITVYTALSQILSVNGFEFFPLQNFMVHDREDWKDSFKIETSGDMDGKKSQPTFVCMYIGGTSSYPTGISKINGGQFQDDSIIDLLGGDTNDFSGDVSENDETRFTNMVNAFRVRFGEQNQSMFHDIKIEGNEFPETNESIQILSRIAGDNKKNAPIPKGQNLYNLYENRAYSTTITSLGNVMIQPSQYYQLENVPLFNGAYIILNVEHDFKPNHAETTFEGVKILKYPIPRVTEPYGVFNYEGGTSEVGDPYITDVKSIDPTELMEGQFDDIVDNMILRNDSVGSGWWNARRGGRNHRGIDIVAEIGQEIKSPINGKLINFIGVTSKIPIVRIIPEEQMAFEYIEFLYVNSMDGNYDINKYKDIKIGDSVGKLADPYELGYTKSMTPHVHIFLWKNSRKVNINPTPYFKIVGIQEGDGYNPLLPLA